LELSTDVNTGATTRQDTTWDDRGNVVRVTYYESPDAELQPTVVDSVVDFTYTLDRLDRYTYTRDGNLLADYGYTYDANDLLLEYADAIGGTRRTFEYDANGNRVTQRGYASNGVENFVETYEYDANGNLVVTSSDTHGDGRVDTRCNRSWSVTMSGGTAYNETCTGGISRSVVFDSRGLTLSSEYRTPFDMTEKTTTWRDDCQPEASEEVNVAATVITSYVYDADQRQTRTARDYNGNETFFKTTTYTCD
jgi:YD repeat-containing protein